MTAPVLSTFLWRGEPSSAKVKRGPATKTVRGRRIDLGNDRIKAGSINTEDADRLARPKQKARAL